MKNGLSIFIVEVFPVRLSLLHILQTSQGANEASGLFRRKNKLNFRRDKGFADHVHVNQHVLSVIFEFGYRFFEIAC